MSTPDTKQHPDSFALVVEAARRLADADSDDDAAYERALEQFRQARQAWLSKGGK